VAPDAASARAMQAGLEGFLKALRAHEVAVSPVEAIDAHRAAVQVGFADKKLLRDALCVTLAKSADEVARFETCFDLYFARDRLSRALDEGQAAETAARREAIEAPRQAPAGPFDLEAALEGGDEAGLAAAMEQAAAQVGAREIRLQGQRSLMTRRLLDEMGLRGLEARIAAARESGDGAERALAERLARARERLFAQAGAFVERQAGLYAAHSARRMREQVLARKALTAVEPEEVWAMEALTRRMARKLAVKYARKRRRARRGRLDVRHTLRRSLAHGGVPFEIVWRTQKVDKPKIAVMCDVSRSVAQAAQFLLLFLYCLHEVVERLDAFAFSDHAVAVTDTLREETVDDAISLILERVGFRSTDYGRALADVFEMHGAKIDRRTTLIILGDGRTNYAEPRLEVMRAMAERARAVIWLNPEPETYWGQGDSKMDAYARFCTVARTCNSLESLERLIEDVLRKYLPR
jgi:uncharacterized protein with von Willebrand factor type A (vWA) domain